MTVEALWQEYCDECGVRKKCPHAITGIIYEGDLVGFFTPTIGLTYLESHFSKGVEYLVYG